MGVDAPKLAGEKIDAWFGCVGGGGGGGVRWVRWDSILVPRMVAGKKSDCDPRRRNWKT